MAHLNSTITLKKNTDIIWPLVFIQLLRLIGIGDTITFIIMLGYIVAMFVKAKKIIIPHIAGIRLYLIVICYSAFVGFLLQSTRAWSRDIFYILPTVIIIFLGYFCNKIYPDKSILKTIYVIGLMISIYAFLQLITHPSIIYDFAELRVTMGIEIYEISMIFVAFIIDKFFFGRIVFSRVVDIIMMFVMLAQIILSFGRTQIIIIVTMISFAVIFTLIYSRQLRKNIVQIFALLVVSVVFVYLCMKFVPNDIFSDFSEKWETTNTEINTDQEINSNMDAIQNWRAYEMQSAAKQWHRSSALVMLFGKGLGEGIQIEYVPYTWKQFEIVENGKIPILHNSYYTLLVKSGIVGVIALIITYFSGLIFMFKNIRKYPSIKKELIIVGVFSIGGAIMGYVVNGIFTLHYMFTWGIVLGYVNSRAHDVKTNVEDEEDKSGE